MSFVTVKALHFNEYNRINCEYLNKFASMIISVLISRSQNQESYN